MFLSVICRWTKLLTRTSCEMIKLLQIQCNKHLILLSSEFNYILDQLKSTCSDSTFVQTSAAELLHVLLPRKRKKQSSTGEYAARAFACTRQNQLVKITILTDRYLLSPILSHQLTYPPITFNPSTPLSSPLLIVLHPYAIIDVDANGKRQLTDTGDATIITFN